MRKVGIVASAQTLRHAFNSLQSAAGVDLALRAVLMGHSNSNLTETTYQTVWMDQNVYRHRLETYNERPLPCA